jgi:transcriptional regulator with XRE-family HTH domain
MRPSHVDVQYNAPVNGPRTDAEVLAELGRRLRRYRLQQNVSQRTLAKRAGVSLRTVSNVEAGADLQVSTLVRLLRALGRLEAIDAFLPPPRVSPMELLETAGQGRQRAGRRRG